jgi:antirestriction protein ArdC
MKILLTGVCCLVLAVMLYVTTSASLHQDIVNATRQLWPDPWFRGTLAEAIRATPEMSSAFLCAFFRYRTEDNREQCRIYQQLVESLKDDKKILVMAAAQGHKAADYILNKQEDQIELDDAA